MMTFGNLVRRTRKERGWTQSQLAEQVGVKNAHISDIERGKRSPSEELFSALVHTLRLEAELDSLSSHPPQVAVRMSPSSQPAAPEVSSAVMVLFRLARDGDQDAEWALAELARTSWMALGALRRLAQDHHNPRALTHLQNLAATGHSEARAMVEMLQRKRLSSVVRLQIRNALAALLQHEGMPSVTNVIDMVKTSNSESPTKRERALRSLLGDILNPEEDIEGRHIVKGTVENIGCTLSEFRTQLEECLKARHKMKAEPLTDTLGVLLLINLERSLRELHKEHTEALALRG